MTLPRAALRRPVTVMVAMTAVVLAGLMALVQMPRDILPNLGVPIIYVAQPYGGMDPAQPHAPGQGSRLRSAMEPREGEGRHFPPGRRGENAHPVAGPTGRDGQGGPGHGRGNPQADSSSPRVRGRHRAREHPARAGSG